MSFFVKGRAWLLCSLMLSPPILGFMLFLVFFPARPKAVFEMIMVLAVMAMNLLFFFWIRSIERFLRKEIASKPKRQTTIIFTSAMIYIFAFIVLFGLSALRPAELQDGLTEYVWEILSLLAVVCMVYSVAYVSRTIVQTEQSLHLTSDGSIATFFSLWFFPIGIWYVQPRINRLCRN